MTFAADDPDGPGIAEMRHRTANTFQLLAALARMRGQKAAGADARRELMWMGEAISTLGGLERKRRGLGVSFAEYLTEMAPVWRRRPGVGKTELEIHAEGCLVPDQAAPAIALATQELVANALIHAFPEDAGGRVVVRMGPAGDGRIALTVEDDGRGFDPQSPETPERFGLWLVRSLATQARGQFELISTPGVTARLTFPAS